MSPISYYAAFIVKDEQNNVKEQWPADLVAHFGQQIYENTNCLSAWKVISYGSLVALVDTIKVRVLNFTLEIENVAPDAGEAPLNAPPLPQERVSQVFSTYISGNVHNVATGTGQVTQSGDMIVLPGNFETLREHLAAVGVDGRDIEELSKAIQEDTPAGGKPALGENVQAWIGRMVGKTASGAWNVSTSVAGTVLGKALSRYFGLE